MENSATPRVLIVGAGAMGTSIGYYLTLARVEVRYLVRPHSVAAISRPQVLYSYDDNSLKQHEGYKVISDHAGIAAGKFDYIVITLDGASLQSKDGIELTKAIGKAALGTDTKVILGSVVFDSRNWFQRESGLPDEQFTNGFLAIHAYSPRAVTLPVHGSTDPDRIAKADLAYTQKMGDALVLSDSAPAVAQGFADLYNACGVSRCVVKPAAEMAMLSHSLFAVFAACDVLDWPAFAAIDPADETWRLGIAAMKEIQSLSIHGEAGKQAAEAITETGLLEGNIAWEKQMLPLDLQAFNRFHHGGKVNKQDRAILAACLAAGKDEGRDMIALSELICRTESKSPSMGKN